LEAIGKEGRPVLRIGIESSDPEVRFYAAEALAYLDDPAAAEPLARAAREEPAFRVFALTALSAMDTYEAYDQLAALLKVASAETRYGAFRALWASNPQDPLVRGEQLDDQFSYHVLENGGPPMIHVTRSFRREVVVFGAGQRLATPCLLEAGPHILVKGEADGSVSVSRFTIGRPDQKRTVGNHVDAVIRAVAELDGAYPDVVQLLQEADAKGLLSGRFEIDALPKAGRLYERESGFADNTEDGSKDTVFVSNPLPNLFPKGAAPQPKDRGREDAPNSGPDEDAADGDGAEVADASEKPMPIRSFFGRITGRNRR
jgi:hypothetical protein